MIVVDTSALMAVLFGEPERETFKAILDGSDICVSAGTLIEARMVACGRSGQAMVAVLDELIDRYGIAIVPVDQEQAAAAHEAFVVYGKGGGHSAQLNFGDLFSYALAKSRGLPLLFKGEDFARTDLEPALTA